MVNLSLSQSLYLTAFLLGFFLMIASAKAENLEATAYSDIEPAAQHSTAQDSTANAQTTTTHPVLQLTPDKSEIITFDQEVASIIVGNPTHLNVLLDTPNSIVVVPRAPGSSNFSIIGRDNSIIMERNVVVSAQKENYVRIRRSCNTNSSGRPCATTSVYFCPDMCLEVTVETPASVASSP